MNNGEKEGSLYEVNIYKICISILLFLLAFIFGYLPSKFEKISKNYKLIGIANSFSGGIFLSISLLHLLPESSEEFNSIHQQRQSQSEGEHEHESFPYAYFFAFCGYTLVLFIERVMFESGSHQHSNHKHHLELEKIKKESSKEVNINNNFIINVHKIPEGGPIIEEGQRNSKSFSKVQRRASRSTSDLKNPLELGEQQMKQSVKRTTTSQHLNILTGEIEARLEADILYEKSYLIESENQEKKFKKLFSQKGKLLMFAKHNFEKRYETCESQVPQQLLIGDRINKEVFDETRPSIGEVVYNLKDHGSTLCNKKNATSFLLLLALSVHSFFEGLALGVLKEEREILYMILAIIFHKWVESVSIGISLGGSKIESDVLLILIFLFSITTPVGIILGIGLIGVTPFLQGVCLSLSAGTFLYISASEVIIEEFSLSIYKVYKFFGFFFGVSLIVFFSLFEFFL